MAIHNSEKLAYLAGIIDGEGTIGVYKEKNKTCKLGYGRRALLRIYNTDKNLIEWCRNFFNDEFSCVITKCQIQQKNRFRPVFSVSIASTAMRNLLPKLMPYLIVKKEKAKLVLEILKLLKTNKQNRHHPKLEAKMLQLRTGGGLHGYKGID